MYMLANFVLCARVICWREYLYFISRALELLLEWLIYILYDARASYIWAVILLGWLIYILYHERELYMGGNIVGAVDLYFISRARDIYGREYCWGVDLYFVSCSRELCRGGNIVEAVVRS